MTEDKMLTVRDVAIMLGVSEKDVLDLTESGVLPGYKVAGVYLRFKQEQVQQYKKNQTIIKPNVSKEEAEGLTSTIKDFFYFNDFYIIALIFMLLLGYLVYRGL